MKKLGWKIVEIVLPFFILIILDLLNFNIKGYYYEAQDKMDEFRRPSADASPCLTMLIGRQKAPRGSRPMRPPVGHVYEKTYSRGPPGGAPPCPPGGLG